MNKRERVLLSLFAALMLFVVGGGAITYSLKSYQATVAENEQLLNRIENSKQLINQGNEWKVRSHWIESRAPVFESRQKASSHLLDLAQQQADLAKLNLGAKELLEKLSVADDGEDHADTQRAFATTTVRINFLQAEELALMTWFEGLQKPTAFVGITHLLLAPALEGKKVSGEVELTLYFREQVQSP